jgi:hypothetical protein
MDSQTGYIVSNPEGLDESEQGDFVFVAITFS